MVSQVTTTVQIGLSVAQFNSTLQLEYKRQLALQVDVQISQVSIVEVRALSSRRRLAAEDAIDVETTITTPDDSQAKQVSQSIEKLASNISFVSAQLGVPVGSIAPPTISHLQLEASEVREMGLGLQMGLTLAGGKGSSGMDAYVIVLVIVAVIVIIGFAWSFAFRRWRKQLRRNSRLLKDPRLTGITYVQKRLDGEERYSKRPLSDNSSKSPVGLQRQMTMAAHI